MQRPGKRELSGLGLVCVLFGGWFFVAGFEQPWTFGHICTLAVFASGIMICAYVLFRALIRR